MAIVVERKIAGGAAKREEPSSPLEGDFWYDFTDRRIRLSNGGRLSEFGARVSSPSFGEPLLHTIGTAAITVGAPYVLLRAEGGPGSDTLSTINPAESKDGDVILLVAESGNTITVDTAGNIHLNGSSVTLDNTRKSLRLWYDSSTTSWNELSRATSVT